MKTDRALRTFFRHGEGAQRSLYLFHLGGTVRVETLPSVQERVPYLRRIGPALA